MSDSAVALTHLKRRLERLEPRRSISSTTLFALGHPQIDHALGGGLALGRLHELHMEEMEAASGAGVAALMGQRARLAKDTPTHPLLWLRMDAAEKRRGMLHATGLAELGLDPSSLILALVPDEASLLQIAADAAHCSGLGALVVECQGPMRGLDFVASRRLMLATEASGVTMILLRIGAVEGPGVADTRWRVTTAPSVALDAEAPGTPMFDLELLRRRSGPPAGPWRVEWDRDLSCFREPLGVYPKPALPRPIFPVAASRTVASMRRAV